MVANAFIASINSNFNFRIPPINEEELEGIFLTDPFIDKDGDGKVVGRPGAGLMETLAPLLGISGDKNDFVPDEVPNRFDLSPKDQFVQKYLSLKGRDPRIASEWNRQDAIEAFKDILRTGLVKQPAP
jgi:hypothetical protein